MYIPTKSFERNSTYDRANDCGTGLEKAVRTPPDVRQGERQYSRRGNKRKSGQVTSV